MKYKYIKLFEEYHIPEKVYRSDTTLLDENTFIKLLKENCSQYLNTIGKNCLTRQVPNLDLDELYLIDPAKHERKSVDNIPNLYTLIMDNDPKWGEFPKRKSSICTYYQNYFPNEDFFIVIPFDNAKLGVCQMFDLWMFWDSKLMIYDIDDISSVVDFLMELNRLSKEINGETLENNNYQKLKNQIDNIYKEVKNEEYSWNFFTNELFTTEGFDLTNIGELKDIKLLNDYEQREVWTDSKCLLVGAENYKKFL